MILSDKKRRIIELLGVLVAVAAVLFCLFMVKGFHAKTLIATLQARWVLALACILSVYLLKPLLFFVPSSIQMGFTGVLFPWYIAIIINMIGVAIEMVSGYCIGYLCGKKLIEKLAEKSKIVRTVREKYLRDDFQTVFILHFIPGFPFDEVSMIYGASGNNLLRYVLVSVLGLSPRIIAFSISGAAVTDPLSPQFILPLVIVGAFSFGISAWFKRKGTKEKSGDKRG